MEEQILAYLQSDGISTATRKEIQKQLLSKDVASSSSTSPSSSDVTKKDVKRALKKLVKRGDIVKDGKKYKIMIQSEGSSESDGDSSNNSLSADDDEASAPPFVPIAERIRQNTQSKQIDEGAESDEKLDLDEEIRRLEAELAESDDDEEDDDEDDEMSDDQSSIDDENETSKADDGIICLSSVADERIIPLPQGALPQNKRRKLKNIDGGGDDGELKKSKKRKSSSTQEEHAISEGLKDAVNDLLSNYVPASHLKKPFYCRVCQHQSQSESEFIQHKQSDFHKAAVQQEKKRTYCKLCRKQLTSIVQMEEHLKSRPHREKMDFVKRKQSGGGRSMGRAQGSGASRKQWC